jgi:hypothetical protein
MFIRKWGIATLLPCLFAMTIRPAAAQQLFTKLLITSSQTAQTVTVTAPANLLTVNAFCDLQATALAIPDPLPTLGYQVARWTETAQHDTLDYYPQAGLVYYHGMVAGDGSVAHWCAANPNILPLFAQVIQQTAGTNSLNQHLAIPILSSSGETSTMETNPWAIWFAAFVAFWFIGVLIVAAVLPEPAASQPEPPAQHGHH